MERVLDLIEKFYYRLTSIRNRIREAGNYCDNRPVIGSLILQAYLSCDADEKSISLF